LESAGLFFVPILKNNKLGIEFYERIGSIERSMEKGIKNGFFGRIPKKPLFFYGFL
jgi:hypothetical protein